MKNTFLGFFSVQNLNEIKSNSVVLLGIPFEGEKETKRGAKKAPKKIRSYSTNFSGISSSFDITLTKSFLYDLGDYHPLKESDEIEKILARVFKTNSQIIVLGGDHLITYFMLSRMNWDNNTALVWLDAHADLAEEYPKGIEKSHATTFYNLFKENIVKPEQMLFIGGHGFTQSKSEFSFIKNHSITHIATNEFQKDSNQSLARINQFLENFEKVFLSIDIDVLDQSYVPSVSCPEPFGLDPASLVNILDILIPKTVYLDVVETRVEDNNEETIRLVVALLFKIIELMEQH